ncbi:hypothetical protein NX059_001764 [Plenodomus lindquistii]|nr:hypothetical protein NX059_001764 [Plenodomus lindquistii]
MKSIIPLAAACITAVFTNAEHIKPRTLITIEIAPGETRQITEDERWELSSNGGCGSHFFDISASHAAPLEVRAQGPYPSQFQYNEKIKRLFPQLSWDNIKKNIEHYTTYHTRFSETETGAQASEWLLTQVQDVVAKSKKAGITAAAFPHANWPQDSIVVKIPGRSNRTIIVGAHLDSQNTRNRTQARAPGADDNGTGTFTILEALRVLLTDKDFGPGKLQNTVEFHWYAAEEGGLRGSQDLFSQYAAAGRNVWAMLNQDMTGYIKGTLDAGKPESFGLITDSTDAALNEYIGRVIDEVRDRPRCTLARYDT